MALVPRFGFAQAGWKPTRDVRIMNGFAAGGSGEVTCRIMAEALRPILGQNVIVDTQAGANGFIAAQAVARAAPDGHTVGLATMGMLTISPQLPGLKLPINVDTDLTPIANVAGIYKLLVTAPDVPFKTVPELIAYAKANPGKVTYASAGVGSSPHLATELFSRMAGINTVHIPYKGGAAAIVDMMANRVMFTIGNFSDFLGAVKGGKLHALAFGGDRPAPLFPDLPLIKQFVPGYSVSNWFSFAGPGKLPMPITLAWNEALQKAAADPAAQKRFADMGAEMLAGPLDQFLKEIATYRSNWAGVIKAANIRAD
ncbi:MAG: Bug family tripartite tricarboxylate transporter substrate binding protein [Burkholderiales bacterium]